MNLLYFTIALCYVRTLNGQVNNKNSALWLVKKTETISVLAYPEKNDENKKLLIEDTVEVLNKPGDTMENIIKFFQDNSRSTISVGPESNDVLDVSKIDSALDQLETIKNILLTMKANSVKKSNFTVESKMNNDPVNKDPYPNVDCSCVEKGTCPDALIIKQDPESIESCDSSLDCCSGPAVVNPIVDCTCVVKGKCPNALIVQEDPDSPDSCDVDRDCCSGPVDINEPEPPVSGDDGFSTSIYSKCGRLSDSPLDSNEEYLMDMMMPWLALVKGSGIDTPFSAVFIHPSAVLTIASKAIKLTPGRSLIQYDADENKVISRKLTNIITHPQYNEGSPFENNIAVLIWEKEIETDVSISIACVPPPNYSVANRNCLATEWNITGYSRSPIIYNVTIEENYQCNNANYEMCVKTVQYEKCPLQDGGPVVCTLSSSRRVAVALSVSDSNCPERHKFVNISHYSDWIKQVLAANGLSN